MGGGACSQVWWWVEGRGMGSGGLSLTSRIYKAEKQSEGERSAPRFRVLCVAPLLPAVQSFELELNLVALWDKIQLFPQVLTISQLLEI